MIKAVLFDLDGTLLDTSEGILTSVKYTINKMGLVLPPDVNTDFFIGPPIQMSLQKCFGLAADEAQRGANLFRDYYKTEALFLAKPYEGIFDVLKSLKDNGVKIGVATYKREDYAIDILRHFHISDYCDAMCGADNNNILTKSDIIRNCCKILNVMPQESIYVGDTEHDAKGASEAGLPFVAVTWGFGFNENNLNLNYPVVSFIHAPFQIMDLI